MKEVTIHDANILIDLTNLKLTAKFFNLDFDFHTTDLAFDEISKGLEEKERVFLQKRLNIKTFSSKELQIIVERNKKHRILSIQDCSILQLSISLQGILCTGDKNLKKVAEKEGIETHGTLWIIEKLVCCKSLSCNQAIEKLNNLKEINPRIPTEETESLIRDFAKKN